MEYNELIERNYNEACKEIKDDWFHTYNEKWYEYIMHLPQKLKISYLIIVLDNQIFNGGFHQYFVNGYGQFSIETIEALIIIGALKKAKLLEEALKIVNSDNYSDEIFREKILKKEIKFLFFEDNLSEPLNNLDNIYYDDNEDLESLLGLYLSK